MSESNLSYKDLKEYFELNQSKLPKTVANDYMVVWDLVGAVKINIREVEAEIQKDAKNVKNSTRAKAAKARLQNLYEMCKDETTHNKGAFLQSPFSNFRN